MAQALTTLGEAIVLIVCMVTPWVMFTGMTFSAMSQVGSLGGNFTIGPGGSLIMVLQANRNVNITGILLRYDVEYINACSLVKVYINGAPAPLTPPWYLKRGWSAVFVFNSTNYKIACTLVDEVDFLVNHHGRVEREFMLVRFPSLSYPWG